MNAKTWKIVLLIINLLLCFQLINCQITAQFGKINYDNIPEEEAEKVRELENNNDIRKDIILNLKKEIENKDAELYQADYENRKKDKMLEALNPADAEKIQKKKQLSNGVYFTIGFSAGTLVTLGVLAIAVKIK